MAAAPTSSIARRRRALARGALDAPGVRPPPSPPAAAPRRHTPFPGHSATQLLQDHTPWSWAHNLSSSLCVWGGGSCPRRPHHAESPAYTQRGMSSCSLLLSPALPRLTSSPHVYSTPGLCPLASPSPRRALCSRARPRRLTLPPRTHRTPRAPCGTLTPSGCPQRVVSRLHLSCAGPRGGGRASIWPPHRAWP